MTAEEALRMLADHDGLVRYSDEPGESRSVRVMMRLPWSKESRVIAIQAMGQDDPLDVMVRTVTEALGEVQAQRARRTLHLA